MGALLAEAAMSPTWAGRGEWGGAPLAPSARHRVPSPPVPPPGLPQSHSASSARVAFTPRQARLDPSKSLRGCGGGALPRDPRVLRPRALQAGGFQVSASVVAPAPRPHRYCARGEVGVRKMQL